MGYRVVKKHDNMFSRFDTVPACDGRTDGRTDVQPISNNNNNNNTNTNDNVYGAVIMTQSLREFTRFI